VNDLTGLALLIGEHQDGVLGETTLRTLSATLEFCSDVEILLAGPGARRAAEAVGRFKGVRLALVADSEPLRHRLAEPMAQMIVRLAPRYDAIVAPASAFGKNLMPRVAALLDVMQVSDITRVVAPDTFERPIYAGNAIETVRTVDAKKVITVRASAFPPAPIEDGDAAPLEDMPVPDSQTASTFVGAELTRSARPDLTAARVIVAGGRAFQSAENFHKLLEPLADKLNAAIGASRAAVDAGFAPNDLQVGQTGKVVAPELYIACGISGAIQHLAGMKDSRVIVAINKDPEAPIFAVADYGLVGDIFQILPELEKAL
jgi:electron transfer flavoprotein alpha subunit